MTGASIEESLLTPGVWACPELDSVIDNNTTAGTAGKKVLTRCFDSGSPPVDIVIARNEIS
jgi:hypothetical protein